MSKDMQLTTGDIELALHVLADSNYELICGSSGLRFYPIEKLRRIEKDGDVYYCAKLASIASGTSAVFDCLFSGKSLSELGEKFEFTF